MISAENFSTHTLTGINFIYETGRRCKQFYPKVKYDINLWEIKPI
jgi:hypothetical protein